MVEALRDAYWGTGGRDFEDMVCKPVIPVR